MFDNIQAALLPKGACIPGRYSLTYTGYTGSALLLVSHTVPASFVAHHKVSTLTAMLCLQALLVQSAMKAMTQQTSPTSDSEAQSSGRVTGDQADGTELRAEYEARLAAAADQAEQVGSTAFGKNSNAGDHDSLLA